MGFFGKIVGKAVNDAIYKASDGKKMVSTDYSKAAINIIKHKIENITLFVSIFTTIVFLGFYAFMIYTKHDSVVNIIIYATLTLLLILSTIFDVIIFNMGRKEMNFLKKRSFAVFKKLKRNSLMIFKLVIKLFSIGYAIFVILHYGETTGRVISVAAGILALIVQLSVHFIAGFITDCINYMVIGVTYDVDNSGILFLVDKNKHEKTASNEFLRTKSDQKIIEELERQKEKDNQVESDDNEIKIKYGKYKLECKTKAATLKATPQKLKEAIKQAYDKFNSTQLINNTPEEVLLAIKLVDYKANNKYDNVDDDTYISYIAFVVYYNTIYDASKNFKETNEVYVLDKIFNELTGLNEFNSWLNNN